MQLGKNPAFYQSEKVKSGTYSYFRVIGPKYRHERNIEEFARTTQRQEVITVHN